MEERTKILKIIFLGPERSGKSSLISAFLFENIFIPKKPIIFASYSKDVIFKNEKYKLRLCDTCSDEIIKLHKMQFFGADIIALCIDGSQGSLQQAERYAIESKRACVPILLLITKNDLEMCLKEDEIQSFKKRHKINRIIKTSIKNQRILKNVLESIIEIILTQGPLNTPYCCC
jgi:small GTP-binding protein